VCAEGEAYDLGWSALSKHHSLIPDSEACEVLTDKGYPVELATVALQLGNNDVQRALELLHETLVELSERLGFSRSSSNPEQPILIRRSSSESQLNFVDTSTPLKSAQKANKNDEEDESDRFMNALSELNFGFKIDTNSEPGGVLISKSSPMSADIKMDSSLVMLSPPVKPAGDEITKAVETPRTAQAAESKGRRVTISSFVPPEGQGRGKGRAPTIPEDDKFVDARNFSTPDPAEVRMDKMEECTASRTLSHRITLLRLALLVAQLLAAQLLAAQLLLTSSSPSATHFARRRRKNDKIGANLLPTR
jgi:hypothetical protein